MASAISCISSAPVCQSSTIRASGARQNAARVPGLLRSIDGRFASGPPMATPALQARAVTARARSLGCNVLAASTPTSVRIIIQGRNVEVTPAIQDYCEEKVTKAIAHFEGNIKEVDVKLSVRGGDAGVGARQQRTELTVYTLRSGVVRVEDVEENLYASVDLVCDKVQRKLRKIKEKAVDKGKWPGRGGKSGPHLYEVLSSQEVVDDLELDRVAELPKEVVRAKHIQLEPMTVDEATDRLEAVGHDFFMFLDSESNKVQVVYRRKVHGFGVLVPVDGQ